MKLPRLGVNIDHVATLRNARGVSYPCPVQAALLCQKAGADGITVHVREDRRHIHEDDVRKILQEARIPVNLEMAPTDEMLAVACDLRPAWVCIVPERREEITTEGGLDVIAYADDVAKCLKPLRDRDIKVSLFVDPNMLQIAKAVALGVDAIELHTGAYANAFLAKQKEKTLDELDRLKSAVAFALSKKSTLLVNAGHGLSSDNVAPIAQMQGIHELNIGHSLIADSVFVGLEKAVKQMKRAFATKSSNLFNK